MYNHTYCILHFFVLYRLRLYKHILLGIKRKRIFFGKKTRYLIRIFFFARRLSNSEAKKKESIFVQSIRLSYINIVYLLTLPTAMFRLIEQLFHHAI